MKTKNQYGADRDEQESGRSINAERVYTDQARCDQCGYPLEGRGSQCLACGSLLCTNCIGGDGRCDVCSGTGTQDLPEE